MESEVEVLSGFIHISTIYIISYLNTARGRMYWVLLSDKWNWMGCLRKHSQTVLSQLAVLKSILITIRWCKIYIAKLASNNFKKCLKFATRWSAAGWPGCSTRWRERRWKWPTSVSTPSRETSRRTSPETVLSLHETWWEFLKIGYHQCTILWPFRIQTSEHLKWIFGAAFFTFALIHLGLLSVFTFPQNQ